MDRVAETSTVIRYSVRALAYMFRENIGVDRVRDALVGVAGRQVFSHRDMEFLEAMYGDSERVFRLVYTVMEDQVVLDSVLAVPFVGERDDRT